MLIRYYNLNLVTLIVSMNLQYYPSPPRVDLETNPTLIYPTLINIQNLNILCLKVSGQLSKMIILISLGWLHFLRFEIISLVIISYILCLKF
jgi:hypothetical protein